MIVIIAFFSGIFISISWNLVERDDLEKEPYEVHAKQFYIDCLEKIINMPIAAAGDSEDLNYSTYIGGNDTDFGESIVVDTEGNVYITGYTRSSNFNTTTGAFDETYNGGMTDLFICKLSADGSTLIYSTFIGGGNSDWGESIAIGEDGSAYITRYTTSSDFNTTTGAFDENKNGFYDVIVCKLSADGSTLIYSTFIGGSSHDYGYSIAVDTGGSAYITGYTESSDFNTTSGSYDEILYGTSDVFVSKLNPDGSNLTF